MAANQVFMLSEEPPALVKNKKGTGFEEAMVELDNYVTLFKSVAVIVVIVEAYVHVYDYLLLVPTDHLPRC